MIIQMLFKGPLFKVNSFNLEDHSCLCYVTERLLHLVILFYRKTFKIGALLFVICIAVQELYCYLYCCLYCSIRMTNFIYGYFILYFILK